MPSSERLQQLNDEKAELIRELSQKNRSVEGQVAIAPGCQWNKKSIKRNQPKRLSKELRSQYVEANAGSKQRSAMRLKYLEAPLP